MISRQERGSMGTSSEPRVKTAARRRVTRVAAMIRRARNLLFGSLIFFPSQSAAERVVARSRRTAPELFGSAACRYVPATRDTRYKSRHRGADYVRTKRESPRNSPGRWPNRDAPAPGGYRHPQRRAGAFQRTAESRPPSPARRRGFAATLRAVARSAFETFESASRHAAFV